MDGDGEGVVLVIVRRCRCADTRGEIELLPLSRRHVLEHSVRGFACLRAEQRRKKIWRPLAAGGGGGSVSSREERLLGDEGPKR